MYAKLNPTRGTVDAKGKLNFPGFQEILDFTSAGSESSVSVTVDGDTDKEYKIVVRNTTAQVIALLLNNDNTAAHYGFQYLDNTAGSVTAARTTAALIYTAYALGLCNVSLLTPTGFLKTAFTSQGIYTSGTTINQYNMFGQVWNSTANVTSLDFSPASGNFTSGTRITVYARRSNV
jgi:hypothetical protein